MSLTKLYEIGPFSSCVFVGVTVCRRERESFLIIFVAFFHFVMETKLFQSKDAICNVLSAEEVISIPTRNPIVLLTFISNSPASYPSLLSHISAIKGICFLSPHLLNFKSCQRVSSMSVCLTGLTLYFVLMQISQFYTICCPHAKKSIQFECIKPIIYLFVWWENWGRWKVRSAEGEGREAKCWCGGPTERAGARWKL